MDRRLKIITVALGIVYVVIIFGYVYRLAVEFGSGFRKGFEMAQTNQETNAPPFSIASYKVFYLYLKPEKGIRTFPTLIYNEQDGKQVKAEIEKMVVELSGLTKPQPTVTVFAEVFMILLSLFALFVMVFIPIQTFRLVRSVTKNKIFDPSNIRKLRFIGYALLAFYTADLIGGMFHYLVASHFVNVEGYVLKYYWGEVSIVIIGLVVLMFAEVLKASVNMKEEQDLTV
jgi:hypothetical protein